MKYFLPLAVLGGFAGLLLTGCGPSANGDATVNQQPVAKPFTGQVYEVKMRGTPKGFFFEPNELHLKRGDKVRFVCSEGGPHNVSFNNQQIPERAKLLLENGGKLVGPGLQAPGQTYEIEFTKEMPTGEYNFVCDPHAALGMKGKILVGY